MKIQIAALLALLGAPLAPVSAAKEMNAVSYTGMCDASGAAALNSHFFAVADDESNWIRIYHREQGGPPVQCLDLTGFLRADLKNPETDIEGAARIGDVIYWISSHSRSRSGRERENRHRFFATRIVEAAGAPRLEPFGEPYAGLLDDLIKAPELRKYNLKAASKLAPKEGGGLNIEGLCATPEKTLLIGFRSPVPKGLALLVPILNPEAVALGKKARLGAPIELDLGGMGIRDITFEKGRYSIIGGGQGSGRDFEIFVWDGRSPKAEPRKELDRHHFHAEAIFYYPDSPRFAQVLSDDGSRQNEGLDCKNLPESSRSFRKIEVHLRGK